MPSRKEQTCYCFGSGQHYDLAPDLLEQMLLNSLFAPEDVLKGEKCGPGAQHVRGLPEELVHDLFFAALWPQDPVGPVWVHLGIHAFSPE